MLRESFGGETWGLCLIKGKASLDCSLGDSRAVEAPGCTRAGLQESLEKPGEPTLLWAVKGLGGPKGEVGLMGPGRC